MDGNGRGAKKNVLSVSSGHEKGVDVVRRIVETAAKAKLGSLSLYAFSTENWSRPKKEILGIKKLIISAIESQVPELINQEVRLNFFGEYSPFGDEVITAINKAEKNIFITDLTVESFSIANQVKQIVVDNLGIDETKVLPESKFIDDLGADSLDTVESVTAFEATFGIDMPDDDAETIQEVQNTIDYIERTT